MNRRKKGFTLIELLVVVSIIALLISILLPSLSGARERARTLKCLTNVRAMAQATQMYLDSNEDKFPVRNNAATGGGSHFNAFLPSRTILKFDRRPMDVFACPADVSDTRLYTAGDESGADPNTIGIGAMYNIDPSAKVRYSYGINNMTGINPTTDQERLLFNPNANAYTRPAQTLLYADCSFFNARAHNKLVNDEPRLKGRVANAAAPALLNVLADVTPEYGTPLEGSRRHKQGSNIVFMDHHGEPVTQADCFSKILYSWTEPISTAASTPPPDSYP